MIQAQQHHQKADSLATRRLAMATERLPKRATRALASFSDENRALVVDFIMDCISQENPAPGTKSLHIINPSYFARAFPDLKLKDATFDHVNTYLQGMIRTRAADPEEKCRRIIFQYRRAE